MTSLLRPIKCLTGELVSLVVVAYNDVVTLYSPVYSAPELELLDFRMLES